MDLPIINIVSSNSPSEQKEKEKKIINKEEIDFNISHMIKNNSYQQLSKMYLDSC